MTPGAEFADVFEQLRAAREELRARHAAGGGGLEVARARAAAMDDALVALWSRIAPEGGSLALLAIGGYGRGELSPASDLDLMVLHAGDPSARVVSERLYYALWDNVGVPVGHATRTVKECLRLARTNLEAETSFLTPRRLAGAQAAVDEFMRATLAATKKRRAGFVHDVREMMRARHVASGSATSQVEPNLKEGIGGLRDLHVMGWFERVVGGDLLSVADRAHLEEAADLLLRVRDDLHDLTGSSSDVLLLQHQRPIALRLGYEDGARPAEDELMRALFTATRGVELIVSSVVADLVAGPARRTRRGSGACFVEQGGRVVVVRPPDLEAEPERALEPFALGVPPGSAALHVLEDALEAVPSLPWTDAVRRAFLDLLATADPAMFEAADRIGVMGRLLPEWEAVRCQPQRNPYHRFTVDAHLFNAVAAVRALAADPDPLVRSVWEDVRDRDTLLLAALLHDAGKGGEEDHAVRGERVARAILDRIGIGGARAETIAWLVRNHLLLVEAATRRDLNDENFVVEIATRIDDAERAKLLFLLTVADGHATGPTAWTPWKAGLVTELFTKIVHVIERGELVSHDAQELARMRTAELHDALARHPAGAVEAHLAGMSRGYLLAFNTIELARHFALMSDPPEPGDARANVTPGGDEVYEYTLVARDRPGLFATVSGALALHGINIVAGQGFTRADGIALEVFRCVGAFVREVDPERWDAVTRDVRRALTSEISLAGMLAEKRAAYPTLPAGNAPKVVVDNQASDFATVIEVHARDRLGLLFDVTSALAEVGLDIRVAKAATFGGDVVDVFYVHDLDGQRVVDADAIATIERALQDRLAT